MKNKLNLAKTQIIGILFVVPMALIGISLLLPELPSSRMMRESFWAHKINAGSVYDIVLVGDSRVYRGLDPREIELASKHKIKCFNFGFSSAGLDSFILDRAVQLLRPGGRRILVIGISPNSFMEESQKNVQLNELLSLSKTDLWLRQEIYPELTWFEPYTFSDLYKKFRGENYYERFDLKYGFVFSNKVPEDSNIANEAYRKQFIEQKYSKEAEANFLRDIKKLKSEGIEIYTLRIPTSHSMQILEDKATHQSMRNLIEGLHKMGIFYLEIKDEEFKTYDGSHLTGESARRYSERLGKSVFGGGN